MALVQGSDITTESIILAFQRAVVDNILADAYHAGNIPYCRGFQAVPSSAMDHINSVKRTPDIGEKATIVDADIILKGLIDITRELTRVGTFTFTLYMKVTRGGKPDYWGYVSSNTETKKVIETMDGKVIYNKTFILNNFGKPSDVHGVKYGEIITASNLNELLAAIYSQWATSNLPHQPYDATICHDDCHNNCHFNCHRNCHINCHGWTVIRNA